MDSPLPLSRHPRASLVQPPPALTQRTPVSADIRIPPRQSSSAKAQNTAMTTSSPLAYLGRTSTPDLSLLGGRASGQLRKGKDFSNPFGSERSYKSPFIDTSQSITSDIHDSNEIPGATAKRPIPPIYASGATSSLTQNGSVGTLALGNMFQQQNPQMTQYGRQVHNVQQQAPLRQQMQQGIQQRIQQEQQRQGIIPVQYEHMQAQQKLQMQDHADRQAQIVANYQTRQAQQMQQMQLNGKDNVLAESFGKMRVSSQDPFEANSAYTRSDFHPYEVDVKTERQMFVNDVPLRRDSSIGAFPKFETPPTASPISNTQHFRSSYQRPQSIVPSQPPLSRVQRSEEYHGFDSRSVSEGSPARSTISAQVVDEPVRSFFMHFTLSEDRCGDQDSVMAQRLAALGTRHRDTLFREHPETFHNPGDRHSRATEKKSKLHSAAVLGALRLSRLPEAERQGAVEQMKTRAKKPKIRRGCFTCRKRHLRCDEGQPVSVSISCLNCRKSRYEYQWRSDQNNERSASLNSNSGLAKDDSTNLGAWGTWSGVWGSNKIGPTSV